MADGGPIPGWGAGPAATPDADPAKRSIPARLSEAWQLYRGHARPLLAVTLLFQGLFGLPVATISTRQLAGTWMFSGDFSFGMSARSIGMPGPFDDIALDYAFFGAMLGVSIMGYLLAAAAVSALLLARGEEAWQPVPAIRRALGRGVELIGIGLAFGVVAAVVFWAQGTSLARQLAEPLGFRENAGAFLGATLLLFAIEVAAVYGSVRWVTLPAVLALEDRPLGVALARSSDLTHGRRRWIFGHLFGAGFVCSVVALGLTYAPALIAGAAFGWPSAATFAILALSTIAGPVLIAPMAVLIVVGLYRDLRDAGPRG